MNNVLRLVLSSVLLIFLAACGNQQPVTAPPQQQTVDGLTIELSAVEAPKINQPQQFRIALRDSGGQPVSDAQVYIDLDMPAMPMATNQPIATHSGDGVYLAESVYTMTGEWELTVVVTTGGKEYRAIFEREVTP
jgi:nitrogen fixation protein FixH